MIGCVTDLGNNDCDDLRLRFVFKHIRIRNSLIIKYARAWQYKNDGAMLPKLKPCVQA